MPIYFLEAEAPEQEFFATELDEVLFADSTGDVPADAEIVCIFIYSKIDAVFQAAISQLRQKKQELDQQEEELSQMIGANADETAVTRQVDKVESIRASMNKMRTLMLLHERQVLTPEQRTRLNKLHEQMIKDRKTSGEKK